MNKKKPKINKFYAKKIEIDGIKFPSTAEARYYLQLRLMKETGKIKDFELQPTFIIQDKFKYGKTTIGAIKYTPDFLVTFNDDSEELIDIKGTSTEASRIRRKMFLKRYPDKILKWLSWDHKKGWIDYFNKK